jgi:hypothetical protein
MKFEHEKKNFLSLLFHFFEKVAKRSSESSEEDSDGVSEITRPFRSLAKKAEEDSDGGSEITRPFRSSAFFAEEDTIPQDFESFLKCVLLDTQKLPMFLTDVGNEIGVILEGFPSLAFSMPAIGGILCPSEFLEFIISGLVFDPLSCCYSHL